ncbi:hypothetical protein [Sphingorhabdus sp. M41]|uniref:hypothetical protein n=1 Tax=Sphingorhabdus sp. M41 TaxID=1806885 RepID=UPI00078CC19C|nr:hypothetical protein [Sphingorhabdus sp. M41]AMO72625.1 hypothetical protein AZE99_12880 [Sphingorhabdus sp. M41]
MNAFSTIQSDVSPLCRALAAELRQIGTIVTGIAHNVMGDEDFILNHIESFQQFDLVIQSAEETARVLDHMAQGISGAQAVDMVSLEAIQQRLHRACREAD